MKRANSNNEGKKRKERRLNKRYKKPGIHEVELSVRAVPVETGYSNY